MLRLYFRAADQTAAGLMAEFSFPGTVFRVVSSHDILKKKHRGMDLVLKLSLVRNIVTDVVVGHTEVVNFERGSPFQIEGCIF